MSWWRHLSRGIADLRDRSPRDRDAADEVAHYREALVQEGIERGLSRDEARREAQLAMGGEAQLRETARSVGWERGVASVLEDLRYAWRGLRGDPGFSIVAVLTIAIGIGGATAIYSAVRPVLFDALPYPHAERVRMIVESAPDGSRGAATFGMFRGLEAQVRSFTTMSVFAPWRPTLTGAERPERLIGQRVSAAYFDVLGVPPQRGCAFTAADDRPGSAEVAVISDALWRRKFAADPDVIGRTLTLDDATVTVIGVMPPGFENVTAPDAELWTPLKYDLTQGRAWGHHLALIGRLREGVAPETATAELNLEGARIIREQQPATYGGAVIWTAPSLQEDLARDVRPALLAILVAVGVVLLLACVNVTNLLLVRAGKRREEFALRAALGASRGRLVQQVLTESLLLAGVGGVLGIAVASAGVSAIVAASPPGMPRIDAMAVERPVLLFAFAMTTLAGIAFGLLPALQASAQDRLAVDLGSTRVAGGARRHLRGALVATQVALALMLLIGSGLLLRSMQRLFDVSPGFAAHDALTMQIQASTRRFSEDGATTRYFAAVLESVRRVRGVTEAALTSQLPMSGDNDAYGVQLEHPPVVRPEDDREIFRYAVSAGYLEVMGIPLRSGRVLSAADRADAPFAVVINESFARRYFAGVDPLGQRLWIGPTDGQPFTVVGVVGDVKQLSLAGETPDAVYTTAEQWRFEENVMSLVVRGTVSATALVPAVREAVWSVDRDQPVVRVATMEALLADTAAERRFVLLLFQLFAVAALTLTTAGIYGMMSGLVVERTREIGLRSAVGATRGRIVGLVLGQGARVTGVGMVIGVAAAIGGTRLMSAMLYGVSPLDPVTYASVVLLLGVVAFVACAAPAWRATRIDPVRALRG